MSHPNGEVCLKFWKFFIWNCRTLRGLGEEGVMSLTSTVAMMLRAVAGPTLGAYGLVRLHLPSVKIFWLLFHLWKSEKKVGKGFYKVPIRGESAKCYPHSAVYKFQKKGLKNSIHLFIFANYIYSIVLWANIRIVLTELQRRVCVFPLSAR